MAVQAQYPSSLLLLNRNVQQGKNDFSLQPPYPGGGGGGGFVDQHHMIFSNNGVGANPRKRNREETTTATTTGDVHMNLFSFSLQNHQQHQRHQQNQNQNHQLIDLSLLQNQPNVVSTGLRLSFGEQSQQHFQQQQQQQIEQQIQQQPTLVSLLSEDLSLQLKQQTDELNYFLQAQGEHLRRALAEKRRRHYRALLDATEEAVAREIKQKDVEVEKAARRNAELEAQWAQLCAEAQSWRARAQAHEAQAVALQAQIQQAQADAEPEAAGAGLSCAEDSESAYVDPVSEHRRVNSLSCKVCRKRVASVVLLPCRHLCICTECDGVVSACPLCLALRSASVEVFLT